MDFESGRGYCRDRKYFGLDYIFGIVWRELVGVILILDVLVFFWV